MTTIKDIGHKSDCDFTLWYKARDDDPEDFVSLHPCSDRAFKWCEKNNINMDTYSDIGNDEANALREYLEAKGFKVVGCS
jgi:hypothetical protein